ncbi:PEGA domain-containing protein [uncultured Deinococcus sp.]|uniref:PEGA domain-containing protein n=1 Tax=uncultured Deinococcus sp. TaxID=158789 RepID=UPI0025D54348|nr:PEGA domain-containing protein [uncultured Deinococcus sp.]
MKSIGSYVAARHVPAGPEHAAIQTLRATDRLTGMPVLLHVLPHTPRLPALPEHPQLLPIVDHGDDGTGGYVVTELPMQATPASDALLAARDGLEALAALHMHGLTHGGISAAQLWEVDGRVVLAGAGLPWQDDPTTGGDLRDLARTVDSIGGLPAALSTLREAPDSMDARTALSLLDRPAAPISPPADPTPHASDTPDPAPPGMSTAPQIVAAPLQAPPVPPAPATPTPETRHDGSPIVLGSDVAEIQADAPPAQTPGASATPLPTPPDVDSRTDPGQSSPPASQRTSGRGRKRKSSAPPAPPVPEAATPQPAPPAVESVPDAVPDSHTVGAVQAGPSPEAPAPPSAPDSAPTGSPVPAYSNAPAGTVETPQERRRRQNEERRAQAMLDMQAAAARKAERLRAEAEAAPPTRIQIGFAGGAAGGTGDGSAVLGEDDLPTWPGTSTDPEPTTDASPRPRLQMRNVERLPASLRRAPEPEPVPELPSGRLPARHVAGAPIRIGWDEDDSWRVVKTAPEPPASRRGAPRWLLPVLGAALLTVLAAGVVNRISRAPAATAVCCDVAFTLRGAAGATARVSVVSAPPDANLTPGQDLGRVPGQLRLPEPGTYRLRVDADGYAPGELSVTAPRTQPVTINLGP